MSVEVSYMVSNIRLIVGITGASGTVLGVRLLEELKKSKVETHVIVSRGAYEVAKYEMKDVKDVQGLVKSNSLQYYDEKDISAKIASGSYETEGMIIAPCSMKTLSSIAWGYGDNLISRAADVCIRYKRRLVVVPRETPLNAIHLENMAKLSRMGVWIVPPNLSYYHNPKTLEDMTDFMVGKMLDCFGIEHELYKKWGQ